VGWQNIFKARGETAPPVRRMTQDAVSLVYFFGVVLCPHEGDAFRAQRRPGAE
jgi:hypothetical protein